MQKRIMKSFRLFLVSLTADLIDRFLDLVQIVSRCGLRCAGLLTAQVTACRSRYLPDVVVNAEGDVLPPRIATLIRLQRLGVFAIFERGLEFRRRRPLRDVMASDLRTREE